MTTPPGSAERSKADLRREAVRRRATLPPAELSSPVHALVEAARRVASYVPVGNEPGVPPQPGWLLPVLLEDGDLDWAVHDGDLVAGPRGLLQPAGPRLGVEAVADCDLVLVPALLVDTHGTRLGRGGGSYDRALARATGRTVALLHVGELVDALPSEPHDVPVSAVVTPSRGLVELFGKM